MEASLCCAGNNGVEKLEISGSPGQVLVIHQPEPGSASERALALLASLTAEAAPTRAPHRA